MQYGTDFQIATSRRKIHLTHQTLMFSNENFYTHNITYIHQVHANRSPKMGLLMAEQNRGIFGNSCQDLYFEFPTITLHKLIIITTKLPLNPTVILKSATTTQVWEYQEPTHFIFTINKLTKCMHELNLAI